MSRIHALVGALAIALVAGAACGGGNNNNVNNNPGNAGGGSSNPCASAGVTEDQAVESVAGGAAAPIKKVILDGDPRGRLYEALWVRQEAERRRQPAPPATADPQPSTASRASVAQDIGEIAVLQD